MSLDNSHLGKLVKVFKPTWNGILFSRGSVYNGITLMLLGPAFFPICGIIVSINNWADFQQYIDAVIKGVQILIFTGPPTLAVYYLLRITRYNKTAAVHERGLVYTHGKKVTIVQWTDNVRFESKSVRFMRHGREDWTRHRYILHLEDGKRIELNNDFEGIAELGAILQNIFSTSKLKYAGVKF